MSLDYIKIDNSHPVQETNTRIIQLLERLTKDKSCFISFRQEENNRLKSILYCISNKCANHNTHGEQRACHLIRFKVTINPTNAMFEVDNKTYQVLGIYDSSHPYKVSTKDNGYYFICFCQLIKNK